MKRNIILGTISALFLIANVASAQTADIASLQKIIDQLRAQIAALQQTQQQNASQMTNLRMQLQLSRNLHQGESGDDVKLLQQTLATDPTLFTSAPTGFYGSLTLQAVKKLQERLGLEQTGEIGPLTRSQLNQLFSDISSSTMSLPAGLLRGGFAPLHIDIMPVGNATMQGDATIFPIDASSTRVVVHFASQDDLNASGTPSVYATHIHSGACASSGPIAIPLTDIVNNKSETTISYTIANLVNLYPLSLMVHKSGVVVGCGDLSTPRPIFRKMDLNGDGKIDGTDMTELQKIDRMHRAEDNATSTNEQNREREQNMHEWQQKFNDLKEKLWKGAAGLMPGMQQREGGDNQGRDGQNREGQ